MHVQAYKGYIRAVVTRVNTVNGRTYSEDPTVFSWELANEPTSTADETGQTVCLHNISTSSVILNRETQESIWLHML